jgi:hypothetical protein
MRQPGCRNIFLIFRHPAFLFSNAFAEKANKEVTPTMAGHANGCSVKKRPPAPAGGLDSQATLFHKNTIMNGSHKLYPDGAS